MPYMNTDSTGNFYDRSTLSTDLHIVRDSLSSRVHSSTLIYCSSALEPSFAGVGAYYKFK